MFNPLRFLGLMRAHISDHWREYLGFVTILAILMLVVIALMFGNQSSSYNDFDHDSQGPWFYIGLVISSLIFTGRYFQAFNQPGALLIWLMRPASILEKSLLAVLVVTIAYPIVYTIVYTLLMWPFVQAAANLYQCTNQYCDANPDFSFYLPLLNPEKRFAESFSLLVIATAQIFLLCGTSFFKKAAILKTIICTFLIGILFLVAKIEPQPEYFLDDKTFSDLGVAISWLVWLGLPFMLFLCMYFHLKQREAV